MKVLKELIARESHDAVGDLTSPHAHKGAGDVRHKLQCIVTAFELLSGQGHLPLFSFFPTRSYQC